MSVVYKENLIAGVPEDNRVLMTASAIAIPAAGSSASYDMDGLTADHWLVRWNFMSGDTQLAENAPPCDLAWSTAEGYFTIENTGGSTSATCQPIFALPDSITVSAHSNS